nr:hypothetical protein [uncultured Bacillus sp.]
MGICPVCNGLKQLKLNCPSCNSSFEDMGRMMDYFDDYSPYMQIDQLKLEDGFPDDAKKGLCPHFLRCSHCGYEITYFIKE